MLLQSRLDTLLGSDMQNRPAASVEQICLLRQKQPEQPMPFQRAAVDALRILARHQTKRTEPAG